LCEFPKTRLAAAAARASGETAILGAPNVIRGGSQSGGIDATTAIRDGLCDVLASDYYYPAMLQAAMRLCGSGMIGTAEAWSLVARAPAMATGLADRGALEVGLRADIIVVDDSDPRLPRVVAAIAGGQPALVDGARLRWMRP
jgi:alpha-D-ribose 1-methylphosphonate 5-triphosphate diphosphatase